MASKTKSLPSSLCKREEFPLFGKWFDKAHHPELAEGEGLGEIFVTICLFNYGLLSESILPQFFPKKLAEEKDD